MRGLAIATLFLGLCLIDQGHIDPILILLRSVVFLAAWVAIGFGV
jgi:hypothetical protein